MNYISTLYANRKKDLPNITLRSYYTDKHGATRNRLGSQFRSIFYKTMEREWEQNPLLLFSVEDFFEDDGETEDADEAKKRRQTWMQNQVESLQCQATWRADRCIKNLGGYPEGHPIDG